MSAVAPAPITRPRRPAYAVGLAAGLLLASACAAAIVYHRSNPPDGPAQATKPDPTSDRAGGEDTVRLPEARWAAAGVRVEPAVAAPFTERVLRSGRLTLDETRVAHISPTADGVVREVKVRLGRDVKAGEVLAVLDCREVGQAKLDLVKARMATEYARTQHAWAKATGQAANDLAAMMAAGTPVADIDRSFRDRPIGDLRQQLTTAYSRRLQAKAHYETASQSSGSGAIAESTLIRLRADYEAAEATLRALYEEVKYRTGQEVRAAEQKLREAETAEALGKSALMMLGYSRAEVDAMDPLAEGPDVSLYPVRAPFAGTVIAQHAVRAERVGPQVEMFRLADLSTLWLQADVPQKDLPLVREAAGGKLRFRAGEGDNAAREAEVFYTGDLVDRDTRAVALSAAVANPDRALKPGMFVEVELTRPGGTAVQVPETAVQRQGTQPFVFVHAGGGEFRRTNVTLGRSAAGVAEVVSGLSPGQPVAVAGGFVLKSELFKDQMIGE